MELDLQKELDDGLQENNKMYYKHTKLLIIALIVSMVMVVITNVTWAWLFNQYDYVTEWTIEQGEGTNTIEGSFNERMGE